MRARSQHVVTILYQSGASFISGFALGLWLERRHNARRQNTHAPTDSFATTAQALKIAERYRDRGDKEAK